MTNLRFYTIAAICFALMVCVTGLHPGVRAVQRAAQEQVQAQQQAREDAEGLARARREIDARNNALLHTMTREQRHELAESIRDWRDIDNAR